ncbi:MAG: alpha-glucosidase [Coriobacteriales bacterium]|nr:alpha-glucosidase [Coriobacteriales bacterium]
MRINMDKNAFATRRGAIAAFVGASGLVGAVALGGCAQGASNEANNTASSNVDASAAATLSDALADMAWWQKTVVYEAYPKSFLDTVGQGTGTLAGITQQLDYLASLGVGAIWLTPVYKSPQKDNGYDISDYYDIDPRFGTMEDMEKLIGEAAKRDIRIVMDLVMNHTSNENAWFVESSSSKDNPKSDWYIWRDAKMVDGKRSEPTNWRGIFGGPAWTWNEKRQQYYLHTFADFQPDLNWECDEMRKELYNMAKFWLDKGLGGFRIDAVTYIKKPEFADAEPDGSDGIASIHNATANTPGILDFLNEFKAKVMEGSDAFTVAEANGVDSSELGAWVGEKGVFDMLFEFSHTLVVMGGSETWYEAGEWTLTQLKAALTASQEATATNGWYPIYFENHDQARSVSQFLPGSQDKVAGAKMLGTVLMTLRGTPFVYEGEELGYENVAWPSIDDYDDVSSHNQYQSAIQEGKTEEEALACVHAHSRDNARTPMQWNDGTNAGFTTEKPWLPVHDDYVACNVEAQDANPGSVLSWYRSLAELRASMPVLIVGSYHELLNESEEIYAFERAFGDERAVVLANFTEGVVSYDASVVEGLTKVFGTHGVSNPGTLQPFEAAVFSVA